MAVFLKLRWRPCRYSEGPETGGHLHSYTFWADLSICQRRSCVWPVCADLGAGKLLHHSLAGLANALFFLLFGRFRYIGFVAGQNGPDDLCRLDGQTVAFIEKSQEICGHLSRPWPLLRRLGAMLGRRNRGLKSTCCSACARPLAAAETIG